MLSQLGNIPYFHVSKFETTASVVTWVSGLNDIRDMPVRMGMVFHLSPAAVATVAALHQRKSEGYVEQGEGRGDNE